MFSNKKYILIGVLVCITIIWLILSSNKTAETNKSDEINRNIKTEIFKPIKQDIIISSYGTINSLNKISVYSEITGTVKKKLANDRMYITKGMPIIEVEMPTKYSQLQKVESNLKQKEIEYYADKNLHKKGYISDVKLASSFAAFKAAEDDSNKIKDLIDKSTIKAKISGMINKINVSEGDFITAGGTIITEIIGLNGYIVTCYLSESDILKITENSKATIEIEDGRKIEGTINFISKISEPHTKTYRVDILLGNQDISYPLGSSVKAKIKLGQRNAYNVPGSALILNDDGILGVKTIVDNFIKFIPVDVINEASDQFWITQNTLPNQEINLVILGTNFVKDGDSL
jgi:multidrug efflux system membrane fusion protein